MTRWMLGVCSLAVMLAAVAESRASDWPRWRGVAFDGISKEKAINSDWGDDGPREVWRAKVGVGFSSFAVADGRAFTLGHDGRKRDGKETVYCFDSATGKTLWSHTYDCPLIDRFYEGGPGATPTVDGDRVYTVSKDGDFFCFDVKTGKIHWQTKCGNDLNIKTPEWGYACSPLILGKLVIVEAGHTAAYDKTTGRLVWKSKRYRMAYGSPVPMEHGGRTCVVVLNTDGLAVFDAADGTTLAESKWETRFSTNSTTPMIVGDQIFISTGYGRGCAMFRFTGSSLEKLYENKEMANHFNNCVLIDGHLYGFHGNSHFSRAVQVRCMDWKTGELKWQEKGLGCGSLMAVGKTLVLLSDRGELVVAPASTSGFEPTARAKVLDGKCWTVPVLANGLLYCRSARGEVVCLDVRGK